MPRFMYNGIHNIIIYKSEKQGPIYLIIHLLLTI